MGVCQSASVIGSFFKKLASKMTLIWHQFNVVKMPRSPRVVQEENFFTSVAWLGYTSARNPISDRLLPWRPFTSLFLSLIRDPAWSIRPIRLFAYEAGPIKLLVSGRLCMSSSGYLVEDRFFLSKKRRYLDYIPTGHLSTSSHKSHFKPP